MSADTPPVVPAVSRSSGDPARRVLWVCTVLCVFDVGLSVVSLSDPAFVLWVVQPGAGPECLGWIRRTAWIWAAFAVAQGLGALSPADPRRARLVAFLRAMDVPADLTWLATADGLGWAGTLILTTFPLINLSVAVVLWRAALELEAQR